MVMIIFFLLLNQSISKVIKTCTHNYHIAMQYECCIIFHVNRESRKKSSSNGRAIKNKERVKDRAIKEKITFFGTFFFLTFQCSNGH